MDRINTVEKKSKIIDKNEDGRLSSKLHSLRYLLTWLYIYAIF